MADLPPSGELACEGSVHVPGCDHFPGAAVVAGPIADSALDGFLAELVEPSPRAAPAADAPGLTMTLELVVSRVGRKRCPRCRRLRVLYRLTGFSEEQPVGYGKSRCLECAGLRVVRIA